MDNRFNTGSDYQPHGYKTGGAFEGGEHFVHSEWKSFLITGLMFLLWLAFIGVCIFGLVALEGG